MLGFVKSKWQVGVIALCVASALFVCSCSSAQPASKEETPAMAGAAASESVSPKLEANAPADVKELTSTEAVRTGKENITVLVLNGCGIEGAAQEAADKIAAAGFAQVKADNAILFQYSITRVSYRYEEHKVQADELAALFGVTRKGDVYCYGPDTKDWNSDYDILVMIGDPSVRDNPITIGGNPVNIKG
ncbi:MAG: LytR C-terminal domain-containing protein [Gordonibacter sp.]|nr:LytR C-terminal domain-containing protein [Gordonibacter sp.]